MLKLYLWLVSLNNYWYPLKNCRYILFLIQQSFQLFSHARVCQFILSHAPHSLWLNLLVKRVNWLTETVWLKRLLFSFFTLRKYYILCARPFNETLCHWGHKFEEQLFGELFWSLLPGDHIGRKQHNFSKSCSSVQSICMVNVVTCTIKPVTANWPSECKLTW